MECGLKLCSETIPMMAGASAAGIWRVAHIGDVSDAVHGKVIDLGVEGRANLACRAGIIDHHSVCIDRIDGKSTLLEPAGDGLDIRGRRAELSADFGGA